MNNIYPPAKEFVAAIIRSKLAKIRVAQRLAELKTQVVRQLLEQIPRDRVLASLSMEEKEQIARDLLE